MAVDGVPDGWYDLNAGALSTNVIAPGEAFFLRKAGAGTTTITFVGEVPQGNLTNQIGTLYGFYSSIVPQQATFTAMGFPGRSGMSYTEWSQGGQRYVGLLNYLTMAVDGVPDGWYDLNAGVQRDPQPAVGQGFLIFNPSSNGAQNWGRTFSVN
jgi:sugar (pentulose or hexulose) kinase